MLRRLASVSLMLAACSVEKPKVFELPFVGVPACPQIDVDDITKGRNELVRGVVVVATAGRSDSKRVHQGTPMFGAPSRIALSGKRKVELVFKLCAADASCDIHAGVTYAKREVELDPARLNQVDPARAESVILRWATDPQTIEFVWPTEPLVCGDGSTPTRAAPRP